MRDKARNRAEALKRYYKHRDDPEYKARARATTEAWKAAHPERYKALKGAWYLRNRNRLIVEFRERHAEKTKDIPKRVPLTDEEKERHRIEAQQKFRREHREEIRARRREEWKDPEVRRRWYEARDRRFEENPEFLIKYRLRSRINHAIRGSSKSAKTMELIGCSVSEFRLHIEALWKPGMSWSNLGAGAGTWQIDHINPVSNYDLTMPEGQRAAFHYSNTQPLWYEEHLKKSASEDTGLRRNRSPDANNSSDIPTVSEVVPATRPSEPQQVALPAPGN